ncbi:MAG: hypothetical protein HRT57_08120, partial [Crocinitomicaceae bacterium]|nr:hypothetical protein [Crocinitomicaceae bacterium]
MKTQEKPSIPTSPAYAAITEDHKQLELKYKDLDPKLCIPETPTMALLPFTGYYGLTIDGVKGAFFTVDTNMHMAEGATTPVYHIKLIVSLDGGNSQSFAFTGTTGTFNENKLSLVT